MSRPAFTRSDLCSILAAAEHAAFSGAVRGRISADDYPQAKDDPLAPSSRRGFTLHHCDRYYPLCWLGEGCLMPITAESGTGRRAIAASRVIRDLLFDGDWRAAWSHACQPVNTVPGSVLRAFGRLKRQRGTSDACLVSGHNGRWTEAGR